MSTTRIINGVEYTIPPGTEHVWTPPDQGISDPAPNDVSIEQLIDRLEVHKLVRNQKPELIESLAKEMSEVWSKFKNKSINATQLANELAAFRTDKLIVNDDFDNISLEKFEEVMIRMMKESTGS